MQTAVANLRAKTKYVSLHRENKFAISENDLRWMKWKYQIIVSNPKYFIR